MSELTHPKAKTIAITTRTGSMSGTLLILLKKINIMVIKCLN